MQKKEYDRIRRELFRLWQKIRLTERGRLAGRYRAFLASFAKEPDRTAETELPPLLEFLAAAEKRSLADHAAKLVCEFPDELPITAKMPDIRKAIREHQVVIVCGSTGSGKTTQLPKAALLEGFGRTGRIGCTQPRRLAATALAGRFAAETKTAPGAEVGCKVRFDDRTTDATVVKFMTDGILLAETRQDPLLLQYDCIILDEVHERSLNIDFLLGYLKLLLPKRKDLRVIISSATLESGRISEFFSGAPVIEVEGKLFPIEDIWMEPDEDAELSDAIADAVETLDSLGKTGDILVFLPGEREIRDAAELLEGRRYPHTEILPLFGRLSAGEQNRIFQRSSLRRIVLSTNVAETSLTIPGIRSVIDSGLARLSRYNPKSGIQELRVEFISKAGIRQRRGRCGRLGDGVCIHLYAQERQEEADDYTAPEIQRSSLAGVILQMASLNLPPIEDFPFVDPPSPALIREGRMTLEDLGATDSRQKLTRTGRELAALPVGPRLGKMLLEGRQRGIIREMLVIAAYLSLPDPRERPFEHVKEADAAQRRFDAEGSDFLSALILWHAAAKEAEQSKSALRRFAQKNYLNYRRLTEWRNLVDDLAELAAPDLEGKEILPEGRPADADAIHQTLMSALPRQLGMFDPEKKCYIDRNGRKYQIFPGSVLARAKSPAKWILSFIVVETTRPYARCNASVNALWLEKAAPGLCTKAYDCIRWDENTGFVTARETVMAGQLQIHPGRRCHYGRIHPEKARGIYIRDALASGAVHLPDVPWAAQFERKYKVLRELEIRYRRPESLLDTDAIRNYFDRVLPPEICSDEAVRRDFHLHKKAYLPARAEMVFDPAELEREALFPDVLTHSGAQFKLCYAFDPGEKNDGLTLLVPENDLPLIEPDALQWLVPGYLPWKLELMLKSLPKQTRRALTPLSACIEGFMNALEDGRIFTGQPFADALCDYLAEHHGVVLGPSDFAGCEPPEFLKMKIGVTDARGKIVRILYEPPSAAKNGSRLIRTNRAAPALQATGCGDWPDNTVLPESVAVSPDGRKLAYPALRDEGSTAGISLYLNQAEAEQAHAGGLRRLVKIKFPQMVKHLSAMPKFSHKTELTFFLNDPGWRASLLDHALDASWGRPPETIRSADAFREALEHLRDEAAGQLAKTVADLEILAGELEKTERFLNRIDPDSETFRDASAQLEFLFRPGFLHAEEAFSQYRRYLKSLTVRLERAAGGTARDEAKGAALAPFVRKFRLAAESAERPIEQMPELYEFFLLLEEARIGAYSPEIRTVRKATPAVLEEKWSKMRL